MIPFEDFLFFDSEVHGIPADAMTLCRFSGRLDRERLEKAIHETAERSQIGERCAVCRRNGTLDWSEKEIPVGIRYFHGAPTPETLPDSAISITRESGLRFWIYDEPEEDRFQLWFQFHHLTTDALGSFLFLDEIFERYAGLAVSHADVPDGNGIAAALCPEFSGVLRKTVWKQLGTALGSFLCRGRFTSAMPLELRENAANGKTQIPGLISSRNASDAGAETELPVLFHAFSRQETQEFLGAARAEGVSLNDLLLASVFRAAWRLQENFSPKTKRKAVQIAIPVSLRKPSQNFPLRNLVSVVFLTENLRNWRSRYFHSGTVSRNAKNVSETEQSRRFLHEIRGQMLRSHAEKRAELLLLELKWLCALRFGGDHRWGMKWFLRRKTPLATLVFSNLGVLFRDSRLPRTEDGRLCVGNLTLDEIRLASPRTVDAALTIALGTYAGRMTFGINHDPKRLTDESVRLFEHFLIGEIQRVRRFGEVSGEVSGRTEGD